MRLADFLARHPYTNAEFAELVGNGCSASSISKLRNCQTRPSIDRAYDIEVATNGAVGLVDWQYVPTRRTYDRAYYRRKRRQAAHRQQPDRRAPGGGLSRGDRA